MEAKHGNNGFIPNQAILRFRKTPTDAMISLSRL
jgi:hypothetical protein